MKYFITALISSVLVSSCSSSTDNTQAVSDQNDEVVVASNTGVFLDSAVEGLNYATETLSGVTNSNGEFEYKDGETVTFSLYGQELNSVPGFNIITPFDSTSFSDRYSINLLKFLQTIDSDGDPSNGISVPQLDATMNLTFDQSLSDFEGDTDVIDFVSANTNTSLVSTDVALTHFNNTLDNVTETYSLDLTNKTATSVITLSYCDVSVQGGFDYTFEETTHTASGIDGFVSTNFTNCSLGNSDTYTEAYNAFSWAFSCGPVCTYTELNRIVTSDDVGVDTDGREFIRTIWHTPNSNVVTSTKRIINDPDSGWNGEEYTFTEVITINE